MVDQPGGGGERGRGGGPDFFSLERVFRWVEKRQGDQGEGDEKERI